MRANKITVVAVDMVVVDIREEVITVGVELLAVMSALTLALPPVDLRTFQVVVPPLVVIILVILSQQGHKEIFSMMSPMTT